MVPGLEPGLILVDTNVLVYALNEDVPQHGASRALLEAALDRRVPLAVVPQVLLETYAVLTDRRRVQHPLDPETAWAQVDIYRSHLTVLPVTPDVLRYLETLVKQHKPAAQAIYDFFLAAQMYAHGVRTVCTHDVSAFSGLSGLRVETPESLVSRPGLSWT